MGVMPLLNLRGAVHTCALIVSALVLSVIAGPAVAQDTEAPRAHALAAELGNADADIEARRKAAYALWQLGTKCAPAAPALCVALCDPDDYVASTSASALRQLGFLTEDCAEPLATALGSERRTTRHDAAMLLFRSGRSALPAMSALAVALSDSDGDVRANAAAALGNLGPDALEHVGALLPLLDDENLATRRFAARAIAWIDPPLLVKPMTRLLAAEAPADRAEAAGLLGYCGPAAAACIPSLVAILAADGDASVRAAAARACSVISPTDALDAFVEATTDPDSAVRAAATQGILFTGQEALPHLPRLTELMKTDENASVRLAAVNGIWMLQAPSTVDSLLHALANDESAQVRGIAARAIGDFPDAAERTLPVLLKAATDDDTAVRSGAYQAFQMLEAVALPAADAIVEGLSDSDPMTRMWAAQATAAVGVPARDAAGPLEALLADESQMVRQAAVHSLRQLEAGALPAAAALVKMLGDDDQTLRGGSALALGSIGPGLPDDAVDALRATIANDDAALVRVQAATALAQARPDDPAHAITALVRFSEAAPAHAMDYAHLTAMHSLGQLGSAGAPASAALLKISRGEDSLKVHGAAAALIRIGGAPGAEAMAMLIEMLQTPGDEQTRAAQTIGSLDAAAAPGIPALIELIGRADSASVIAGARGVTRLGPVAESALPALEKALAATKDQEVRSRIETAIKQIRP